MNRLSLTLAIALSLATPAMADRQDDVNAALWENAEIWNGLFAIALGDRIRTHCDSIEARVFRTTAFVLSLYNAARAMGFSRDEIRASQVHPDTAARMTAQVMAYEREHGVREGQPQTFCALGQAEMAARSQVGELLRTR